MEELDDLRISVMSKLVEVYDYAEPVCRKINQELEKNGVENENLYHIPRDLVQEITNGMLEKLSEEELFLLSDYIQVIEAATIRNFFDTPSIKEYIKGKVEQTTELWFESLEEDEE
jgi:hypothetical protein